jgi:SAM-dependent methyltransferase
VSKRKPTTFLDQIVSGGRSLLHVLATYGVLVFITAAISFPYRTDAVTDRAIPKPSDYTSFYSRIYSSPSPNGSGDTSPARYADDEYVKTARQAIKDGRVVETMQSFVRDYHLESARVLDVGAGTGYLQDVVDDYVGLDISPAAARYFHKPFVEASATEMPIPDDDFDAVWSIWVLEHVPAPEQALAEMRRVVKDGGLLFLAPAWDCSPYLAEGYPVRPFRDFELTGKLKKAMMLFRLSPLVFRAVQVTQRAILGARQWSGQTRLHYVPLEANYERYWMPDSDAVNGLDRYEMSLWFTSRGDVCLNCDGRLLADYGPLIIKVHKQTRSGR